MPKSSVEKINRSIALAIAQGPGKKRGGYPYKYHVMKDNLGVPAILKLDDTRNVVFHIPKSALEYEICKYCLDDKNKNPIERTPQQIKTIISYFTGISKPIETIPKYIADKDDPSLAYARLPFNTEIELDECGEPINPGPHPACFQRILDRATNPEALSAFIGSIFYEESDRQQYLFLQGEGNDSKGVLLRFIAYFMGDGYAGLQTTASGKTDPFFNEQLLGKRLGVFADCDHVGFFNTGEFKTLTGGDPINVRRKGITSLTVNLETKFITASNHPPHLVGKTADTRRIIHCEFESVPDSERKLNFHKTLIDNAEQIIKRCKYQYLVSTDNQNTAIKCTTPEDIIEENELEAMELFMDHFTITPNGYTTFRWVRELGKSQNYKRFDFTKIKDTWLRRLPIKKGAKEIDGKMTKVYLGFQVSDPAKLPIDERKHRTMGIVRDMDAPYN